MPRLKNNPTASTALEDVDKEGAAIKNLSLPYRKIALDPSDIDLDLSTTFNARFGDRYSDEIVDRYALLWERGEQFPRITVFFDQGRKKYRVISGVHRAISHEKAGLTTPIQAFEIIVEPPGNRETMDKIAELGKVLNMTSGFGLSQGERLAAAVRSFESGQDLEEIALSYGLREQDILSAKEELDMDRELDLVGLNPAKFVRRGDKKTVLRAPSEFWMHEVDKLLDIKDKNGHPIVTANQLQELVRDLRNEKNDEKRQQMLFRMREMLKQGRPKRARTSAYDHRSSARSKFARVAGMIRGISVVELVEETVRSTDEARAFRTEVQQLQKMFEDIERQVVSRWGS